MSVLFDDIMGNIINGFLEVGDSMVVDFLILIIFMFFYIFLFEFWFMIYCYIWELKIIIIFSFGVGRICDYFELFVILCINSEI